MPAHGAKSASSSRDPRTGLPLDRFDLVQASGRVGAHRIVGEPRRFWAYLVSALLGIVVLTGIGIVVVQTTGSNVVNFTSEGKPGGANVSQTEPELDPEASVVVLNGTTMPEFGAIVDGIITQNSWGQILFSGPAAANDVATSAVFYSDPADEAAALGLAQQLGGVSAYPSEAYTEYEARLVVLLGADYAGPGSEQFVEGAAAPVEDEPAAEEEPVEE